MTMSFKVAFLRPILINSRLTSLHTDFRGLNLASHYNGIRFLSSVTQRPSILRHRSLRSSNISRQFSLWPKPPSPPPPSLPEVLMEVAPVESQGVTEEVAASETLADNAPTVSPTDTFTPTTDSFSETIPSDVLDTATSVIPAAMQYGDLAALGLTGWSPAGLVRWGLEALHVSTGMPWFYTIIAASALVRIFMAPFQVMTTRDTAKLAPYKEQIAAIAEKMHAARAARDPQGMKNATEAQLALYKQVGVNPIKLSLVALVSLVVQIPVSFGLFFGIKKMCEFPIEQLKHSGFSLLPDLTVPDPTYILPCLVSVLISLQSKIIMPDLVASSSSTMVHAMNFLRIAIFPATYFMIGLPSGLTLSILSSVTCYVIQVLTLRIPVVRRRLGLPMLPPTRQVPTILDTMRHIKAQFIPPEPPKSSKIRPRRR